MHLTLLGTQALAGVFSEAPQGTCSTGHVKIFLAAPGLHQTQHEPNHGRAQKTRKPAASVCNNASLEAAWQC